MLRTAIRNLLAHKLRVLATGTAVLLGVSFMSGTMILAATIDRTFDEMFEDAYEGTDAVVRSEAAFETPEGFDVRSRIDESFVERVAAIDGVAVAQPDVWGTAQVIDRDGEPVGNPGMGPPTIGASWPVDELNTWTLEVGRGPEADDEVAIDQRTADEADYTVGDRIVVLADGAPLEVTVTGVVSFAGAKSPGGASFTLFTLAAAQRHVGEPGMVDSVSIAAEEGVSQEEVVRRVQAILPDGVEAITGQAYVEENQDTMAEALSFFDQFMMVFAVVALLVGGFTIFNTFSITVAQRTRQHALLRAVGASRRQLLLSVMAEALVIGVVASLAGLVAGFGVAAGLKGLLAALGVDLPAGGVVFGLGTALTAFAAGVVVSVVAALSPARKAAKVPPMAALRDIEVSSSGYGSKERIIVGLLVLAAGVTSLLYGLLGSPSNRLVFVGVGAVAVFFGVSILGRTVALPMSRTIGWPLRARGVAGQLARENAMRSPKRTAATASALMIGVGLVSFITILAASTKTSFGNTIDRAFLGDLVVTTPTQADGSGGVSPELVQRLRELPEVEAAGGIRVGVAEVDGDAENLIAADRPTFDIFDVEPLVGSPDDLDATSIAVHEDVAEDEGLEIGDAVPVVFADTGQQQLRVAMVYGEDQPAGDWLLGYPAYDANFVDHLDSQVFISTASGVGAEEAAAAVEREVDRFPGAELMDQDGYEEEQLEFVDQILGLVYALLALAIVIAVIGIGNTLALSIFERTRELGLLRAVGMTRRQLRSMVRWEAVIIALQGTVLGLAIGVFFGWAMVRAMEDEGLNALDVPLGSLAVVVVLAAIAGVAASLLPARRAAHLDVMQAVVSQ